MVFFTSSTQSASTLMRWILLVLLAACSKPDSINPISNAATATTSANCPSKSGHTLCGYCESSNLCRYCPSGYACTFTQDVCTNLSCPAVSGSSTNSATSNTSSSSSSTQGATSNCSCPGNNQCSQKVGCLQSCTCYYTINGSDASSAWYLVGSGPAGTGTCYMCAQSGLGPNCSSAANSAAAAAASLIAAGQCG